MKQRVIFALFFILITTVFSVQVPDDFILLYLFAGLVFLELLFLSGMISGLILHYKKAEGMVETALLYVLGYSIFVPLFMFTYWSAIQIGEILSPFAFGVIGYLRCPVLITISIFLGILVGIIIERFSKVPAWMHVKKLTLGAVFVLVMTYLIEIPKMVAS